MSKCTHRWHFMKFKYKISPNSTYSGMYGSFYDKFAEFICDKCVATKEIKVEKE